MSWNWTEEDYHGSPSWVHDEYRIVYYSLNGYYQAFFRDNKKVRIPPDSAPCKGCGSAHCRGWHACWLTLGAAKRDCVQHNKIRREGLDPVFSIH